MITIEKQLQLPNTYPLERIGNLEDLLFFDIETTGFSGDRCQLYLIGCTYYKEGSWNLIQWFADTKASEEALLHHFFAFLKNYKIVVHFNGDGFDIPFLQKRCKHFDLPYDFSGVTSFDIYKKIKPYRKLLGLDHLKQKSIEQFLGIARTDKYNGGELIEVYRDYLMTKEQELYDRLILHNEDDLKGMPLILPILNYPDVLEHPLTMLEQQIVEEVGKGGKIRYLLKLTCQSPYSLPVPIQAASAPAQCLAKENQLTFLVELKEGTLKHFYPDYKNYYYLPLEDRAVPKVLADGIEKDAKVRATAATCYTKINGFFLPQFQGIWEPILKEEVKANMPYAALQDVDLAEEACFQQYTQALLAYLRA